ncbi:Sodium/hydrogen exchanger 8 [Diplonema papillatum]|nr:Sodium/hydrogen exchanger 8 [Diplonema papillatum]
MLTWLGAAAVAIGTLAVSAQDPALGYGNATDGECDGPCPDCSEFAGGEVYWFELECPEQAGRNASYCASVLQAEAGLTESPGEHTTPHTIIVIFGSFGIGAAVRFFFKGSPVPYTVVLFAIGMLFGGIGKLGGVDEYVALADMNPHLIFHVFLPVLVFESAFAMPVHVFKKVAGHCLVMAGPGLILASLLTACVVKYVFTDYGWTWPACLLLGTILSATDPVAVVALLKDLGASPVISTMIEGESLFNDGTAIVFFTVLQSAVQVQNCEPDWATCHFNGETCLCSDYACTIPDSAGEVALKFLRISLGGPLVGLAVGAIAVPCLQRVFNDALVEITITLTAAYVTFFVAEEFFAVSGVLGVVTTGLLFWQSISPEVEHTMHHFWEMVVYLTNTMIFMLAGLIVAMKAFDVVGTLDFVYLGVLYVAINLIRVLVIVVLTPVMRLFETQFSFGENVLVAWGGLRGAVGLALTLIVSSDETVTPESLRTKFVFHMAGIVVLTLCINGVTTRRIVAYFGLNKIPARNRRMMQKRYPDLKREQQLSIADLRRDALYYDTNWSELGRLVDLDLALPSSKFADPSNKKGDRLEETEEEARLEVKHVYLNTAQASVYQQYSSGILEPRVARHLLRVIESTREIKEGTDPDNPDAWLTADMVEGYFSLPRFIGDPSTATGLKMWILLKRWKHAFSVTLGWDTCHRLAAERAPALLPRGPASTLIAHCKRCRIRANSHAETTILQRTEISCMIKTKHAARYVLNHMRQMLGQMANAGRLDAADKKALMLVVEEKMKQLRKFPSTLRPCTAEEALKDTPWFSEAGEAGKEQLLEALATGSMTELVVEAGRRVEQFGPAGGRSLTGLYLVVSGIVEVRVGRRPFRYGSGYTVGLQQLLTPDPGIRGTRFSNAWTASRCRLLYMPAPLMLSAMAQHPGVQNGLWRHGGAAAARILIELAEKAGERQPLFQQRIARVAQRGTLEFVLDADEFEPGASRQITLPRGAIVVLLRGVCWEYERRSAGCRPARVNEFAHPCLLPPSFRFATFSEHATLWVMPEEEVRAGEEARKSWRRLRAKIKAITLWVGLLGDTHRRNAVAVALGMPTREEALARDAEMKQSSRACFTGTPGAGTGSPPPRGKGPKLRPSVSTLMEENRALQQALDQQQRGGSSAREGGSKSHSLKKRHPVEPLASVDAPRGPLLTGTQSLPAHYYAPSLLGAAGFGSMQSNCNTPLLSNSQNFGSGEMSPSNTMQLRSMLGIGPPLSAVHSGQSYLSNSLRQPSMNNMSNSPRQPQQSLHAINSLRGISSLSNINSCNPAHSGNPLSSGDDIGKLKQLAELRDEGLVTASEFTLAKRKILGISDAAPDSPYLMSRTQSEAHAATPRTSSSSKYPETQGNRWGAPVLSQSSAFNIGSWDSSGLRSTALASTASSSSRLPPDRVRELKAKYLNVKPPSEDISEVLL